MSQVVKLMKWCSSFVAWWNELLSDRYRYSLLILTSRSCIRSRFSPRDHWRHGGHQRPTSVGGSVDQKMQGSRNIRQPGRHHDTRNSSHTIRPARRSVCGPVSGHSGGSFLRDASIQEMEGEAGYPWTTPTWRLLLFADDCWIIVTSPAELRCMARAWNELLERAGLRIAWQEAVWCPSAPVWKQLSLYLTLRLPVGGGKDNEKNKCKDTWKDCFKKYEKKRDEKGNKNDKKHEKWKY